MYGNSLLPNLGKVDHLDSKEACFETKPVFEFWHHYSLTFVSYLTFMKLNFFIGQTSIIIIAPLSWPCFGINKIQNTKHLAQGPAGLYKY